MPLKRGTSSKTVSRNIKEFRTGETFAKTARKFGAARAQKQAIAVALATKRRSRKK